MMTRCNNCKTYFDSEDDLTMMEDQDGVFKGCPKCKTDGYLMDGPFCPHCEFADMGIDVTTTEWFSIGKSGNLIKIDDAKDIDKTVIYCGNCGKNLDDYFKYDPNKSNFIERRDH